MSSNHPSTLLPLYQAEKPEPNDSQSPEDTNTQSDTETTNPSCTSFGRKLHLIYSILKAFFLNPTILCSLHMLVLFITSKVMIGSHPICWEQEAATKDAAFVKALQEGMELFTMLFVLVSALKVVDGLHAEKPWSKNHQPWRPLILENYDYALTFYAMAAIVASWFWMLQRWKDIRWGNYEQAIRNS